MKRILLAATLAFGFSAFANDSGIAVVNVAGIVPSARAPLSIAVIGPDTAKLRAVLPLTTTAVPERDGHEIYFASPGWAASISCDPDRDDQSDPETAETIKAGCQFRVERRSESPVDDDTVDKIDYTADDFKPFVDDYLVDADEINNPANVEGLIFSFYGRDAEMLGAKVPHLMFITPGRRVNLDCQKDYNKPTTGEPRSDWMCSVTFGYLGE